MECINSFWPGVVMKIGELLVEKIVKQAEHLFHPNKSINNLKEEHELLTRMKQELQGQVNADTNKGHKITFEVQHWLNKVQGIEAELHQLYEHEVNKKNQWCHYSLSKQVAKKRAIVLSLTESRRNLQIISYPPSPPRVGETFTAKIKSFQSRTKIIMEVIEKLKDDEFKRISICGMGGVGKTTMGKEVIKIVEENKIFDKIAFVVMSLNVDYWRVQGDIAGMLGLKFENETLQGRAGEILKRLKSINKVLIVLDDVWTEVDFECIGLPSSIEYHNGCKILLTSRDENVCDKMGSQENFIVPTLSPDEAWDLFREMVGNDVCNEYDIHLIAKQIADECRGLPIAIVTVGKALVNKRKHTWKDVLHQLKNPPMTEMQNHVYPQIQLSYNFLDSEEHKDFLLLCCLFPEDFDIPIEVLMRHGLGLGLFRGVGKLLTARNRVHDLVDNLKSRFLLLDSAKTECVKMHDVVRETVMWIASKGQHKYMAQGGVQIGRFNGGACDYRATSFMLDESELPVGLECSNYQLLQVASMNKKSIPLPEDLFRGMSQLKVLSMYDLRIPKPSSLFKALHNLWTLRLENCEVGDISIIGNELTKLEILSVAHSNINQLPPEIGQLSSLRLLDLTGCKNLYKIHAHVLASLSHLEELYIRIQNFPWKQNKTIFAELKLLSHKLKVFDIRVKKFESLPNDWDFENLEMFWVSVGQSEALCDVSRHGYLYSSILEIKAVDCSFINNNMLMKQLVKNCEILHLVSVNYLKSLNSIHKIDESGLSHLKYLVIESCGDLESLIVKKSMIEFCNLLELKLHHLPNLIGFAKVKDSDEHDQSIQVTESRGSEIVQDELHSSLGKLFTCDWLQRFPKLEKFLLSHCPSLDMVFDLREYSELVGQTGTLLFPQMKETRIDGLSKLRHVWGNVPHDVQGFGNLTSLTIRKCDSLRHVFTPSIVKALNQLEKVEISRCQLMEKLVSFGNENNGDDDEDKEETVAFAKLVSLNLFYLPNLVSFYSDSDIELEWPSLRHLRIDHCNRLNPIQIQKVIESSKQDNVMVSSDIGCSTITSNKGSTRFLDCCFGYANKSTIKASSPNDLDIRNCVSMDASFIDEMEIGLSSSMPIMQHIDIRHCDSMDAIFIYSKRINNSFARVESLKLLNACNLVSFFHYTQDTPSLGNNHEFMGSSNECGTGISHVPFIDGFLLPNLTYLSIERCHKISSLFSPASSSSLGCLKRLVLSDCDNMEEIILGENETQTGEIEFPGLQFLSIKGLNNFRRFCSSVHHLKFPSLQEVCIDKCPKMVEFSQRSSNTPKLQDIIIGGEHFEIEYMHKRDLNVIVRQCKELNVALQTWETMRWNAVGQDILSCFIKNNGNLLRIVPFNEMSMFHDIKKFTVSNCTSLVEVFESAAVLDSNVNKKNFELEEMELKNLPMLMHIWKSFISMFVNFTNLRELRVLDCHNLTSILPFSVAQSLVQLQHLQVQGCNKIEEIVVAEKMEIERVDKVLIIFPKLKELYLRHLPNLKYFCSAASYDFELPSCHEMAIEECPSMTTFSHGTVSSPKLPQIFSKVDYHGRKLAWPTLTLGDLNSTIYFIGKYSNILEQEMQKIETLGRIEHNPLVLGSIARVSKLDLVGCEHLLNCFPSNMIHKFQHLEKLSVKECVSLVEIFESEGVAANSEEDKVLLCELQYMFLHSLPKLASIWKSCHGWVLGFENLFKLEVSSCHSLTYVFPLSITKSLRKLSRLEISNCKMMEEIITFTREGEKISQEPNQAEVMILPGLRILVLKDLPSLKRFCSGPCDLLLPQCWKVDIKSCPMMEFFCRGITCTPKLESLCVEDTNYDFEEGLDAIIQRQNQIQNAQEVENQLRPEM